MPEPREPRSIVEAAEQAAAEGNYGSAEELLREAARLQEATLGPLHPDLAHTLNNLGVVCEITDKPSDAEHCFRRALTIATTVLAPDHPFVATSQKNLRGFCEVHGKPFESPSPPATGSAVEPESQAAAVVDPPSEPPPHSEPQDAQALVRRTVHPLAVGASSAGAVLIVILTMVQPWLSSTERSEPSAAAGVTEPTAVAPPPRPSESAVPTAATKDTTKTVGRRDDVRASRITEASPTRPTVVRARLCAELEEWQCDPADRPVPPGPLFFYTQVKSTSATTITHRWYRGERLYHSVEIRVQASPGVGYRTYSRHTMNGDSTGSWKVELRAADGTLLHEEHFSVR